MMKMTWKKIYSAVRGGGGLRGFLGGVGVMGRKSGKSPLSGVSDGVSGGVGLDGILLPAARQRWALPSVSQITPGWLEQVLRSAMVGGSPRAEQELYTLMEQTWPRLLKNTTEVKDAVLGLEWTLAEAEQNPLRGAYELVVRARDGMRGDVVVDGQGWRDTLGSLLDARFRGVSIAEVEWEYREGRGGGAWLPKQTFDVSPWQFGWYQGAEGDERNGRLMLYPDGDERGAVEFTPHKFLIGVSKAGKGHASSTALLRTLAWWWMAANFSRDWLLGFAEKFGQPIRVANYDLGLSADDLYRMEQMLENMGAMSYALLPGETKLQLVEPAKSLGDNPQAKFLELADEVCDLLLLGQTLTSTAGEAGSRALGEVHDSVRGDRIDAAAQWLAELLNQQLIPAVAAVNLGSVRGDEALPYFQPAPKSKKDVKATAETIEVLLRSGVQLVAQEVYDRVDFSVPKVGDATLGGTGTAASVSGAVIQSLSAGGLRVTDEGIGQLSAAIGFGVERAPGGGAGVAEGEPELGGLPGLPEYQRALAKMPVDAREYFLARMGKMGGGKMGNGGGE